MLKETQIILDQLAVADRAHQKEAGGKLLLRSVKYLCAAVLAAFLVDVILHLSGSWRLGLLLTILCGVTVIVVLSWRCAFMRSNRREYIARLLEMRDPVLGSRLINLLQLREQARDETLAPATRELARQAVEIYAAELGDARFAETVRTGEVRQHLKRAALAVGGFAAILAIGFRVTFTEAARFADPFGDHPPYSFTHLEMVQPGWAGTNVVYGRGLIIKVKAVGHQPKGLFLTSYPPGHPEQSVTTPMFDEAGSGYNQLLDNICTELVVRVHTKDHASESRQVHIGVLLVPQVERSYVQVSPPAYTGLTPVETPYDFKGVQVLEGGEVQFRLQSNRPLREGLLEIVTGDGPPRRIVLKKSRDNEVTGSFIATESGRMRLGVTDVSGLPSTGDYESALTVTHDLPPEIHITNPEHDAFAAMDFKLQMDTRASDDYGLREIRLHRGLNGVFSAPKVFKFSELVLETHVTEDFDFADLGIHPGDVITLFAEALDNAPQPHLARSQMVRLQVISVEDYNNYLREQTDIADAEAKYAALNDDLQALIEKQKELAQAAQALGDKLAEASPKEREAMAPQLDELLAQQNELNAQLNKQAERMDNFVRAQPLYDVEKDLQATLQEQAGNIRLSTQNNDASTRDIAQNSSPSSGSRQLSPAMLDAFKKAADDQVARLGKAHQVADQQTVQKLDDMSQMQELIKDFKLFEALYHAQQDLAQQVQAYNRPGELSREDQLSLKDLSADERQVSDALDQLPGKLREDAQAAEKLFPKAAQSGCDLAGSIERQRMEPLAEQATDRMLRGDGGQSFQLADRLREEMEKLFGTCESGNSTCAGELDTYLKLQRLKPGGNFAQMARSRKFGLGHGKGQMGESGEGMMGSSGSAMMDGSDPTVLGNETRSDSNGKREPRQSSRFGKGAGQLAGGGKGEVEKPDVLTGLNPVNRQSGATVSETVIENYNDVVDSYFKAITTKRDKSANEKSP